MNSSEPTEIPLEAKFAESQGSREPLARSNEGLIKSRPAVIAILFLVTGALGIPLLWMNDQFSPVERIVWSILVTIYTAALVFFAAAVCLWSYHQIFG